MHDEGACTALPIVYSLAGNKDLASLRDYEGVLMYTVLALELLELLCNAVLRLQFVQHSDLGTQLKCMIWR